MSDFSEKIPPDKTAEPPGLSRRRVFQTLLGSAAAIGTAVALIGSDTANAQSKATKKVAKYQDKPKNGQQCSKCRFFQSPNSCQLVAGTISANGWCSFFAAKST